MSIEASAARLTSSILLLSLAVFVGRASAQEVRQEVVHQNGKAYLHVEAAGAAEAPRAHHPDRLLVRFRPGRPASFLPGTQGAREMPGAPGLFLVPKPPGLDLEEAVRRYAKRPDVAFAEPDFVATLDAVPSDARWSEQWDMTKISAPAAWDTHTDSSGVVVAVLDSGIDFSHEDLQANLWTDPVDGAHGYDCVGGTVAPGGQDDNGHGTHVAGTIGAVGDNGLGIAGVNWSVQLLSLKAFNAGGTANISDIVACLGKLVELRQRGFDIRVSNHSWSTPSYSQALHDAFTRVEQAGVLHVCAAGNNGADLDFTPAYPAAFPGRSVLTVASTDANDLMASTSAFGHVEVDLAAPGVGVLSTVPTGTCTHCAPSGYKLLSGTSMATPHVSGVAAALFQINPLLTAAEARDILLDPASFDLLATPSIRASSTTRGRLNFSKVIANPKVAAPQLNGFPTVSAPSAIVRSGGTPVTLSATASDPDGDPLSYQWGKPLDSFLYGIMMNHVFGPGWFFPSVSTNNPYTFTAPSVAVTATAEYEALVNDGRGGSAAASTRVSVLASPSPGYPPSGTISVTPTSGPPGTVVTVSYTGADPEGGPLFWGFSSRPYSFCCSSSTTLTYQVTLSSAGVYRFSGQSIDRELQLSPVSSAVVRIGGATGEPPVADLVLDVTSGPAPLTVNYDASGSYDPDGGALTFFVECEAWSHTVLPATPSAGSCTFDTPGPHTIAVRVYDAQLASSDERIGYVMVTPADLEPDVTAPEVQIASPAAGTPVSGVVTVTAAVSDEIGVTRVELYRDAGVLLRVDTTEPFTASWDTADAALGDHTLYAKAFDQAGNIGVTPTVTVRVRDIANPTVAVVAPASGSSVAGVVTIVADASDNQAVSRVEFYRSQSADVLLGTDTEAPFTLDWDSSAVTPGFYGLWARAYDPEGNFATSALVGVTVLDSRPPTVSISWPAEGASVLGSSVLTSASAADNVGVTRVEFLLDGSVLLGTDTSSPWEVRWDSTALVPGPHTLTARAYDQRGNMGTSATISVTVLDAFAPSVSITAPAANASVSGLVPVAVAAFDNHTLLKVEIYCDSVLLATDTEAPYGLSWDSTTVTPGVHALSAKAYDTRHVSTSSNVLVTVLDAIAPTVALTWPSAGASVAGQVSIAASASDNVGVTRVEFFRDGGTLIATDTNAPWTITWDSATVAPGPHTLEARAYDQRGNASALASVNVTVLDSTPPTVSITSPVHGGTVPKNASTTISVSASDNVGVARVEIYVGSTLLCTDTASPYACAWSVPKGAGASYSLQARAYDARNNMASSAVVQVTSR